jgi:uncharacterized membrane protein
MTAVAVTNILVLHECPVFGTAEAVVALAQQAYLEAEEVGYLPQELLFGEAVVALVVVQALLRAVAAARPLQATPTAVLALLAA